MSEQPLPAPQHHRTAPAGQQLPGAPLAGWPQVAPYPAQAPVELYGDRDPVVHVADAYGNPVAMRRSQLHPVQPTPPRDLTPQPFIDPIAQRLAGAGVCGAGVGWGLSLVISSMQASAGGLLLGMLIGLLLLRGQHPGGNTTYVTNKTVNASNRWFGRSTINQ